MNWEETGEELGRNRDGIYERNWKALARQNGKELTRMKQGMEWEGAYGRNWKM